MGRSNLTKIDDLRTALQPGARILGLDVGTKTRLGSQDVANGVSFEPLQRPVDRRLAVAVENLKKDTAALLTVIAEKAVGAFRSSDYRCNMNLEPKENRVDPVDPSV